MCMARLHRAFEKAHIDYFRVESGPCHHFRTLNLVVGGETVPGPIGEYLTVYLVAIITGVRPLLQNNVAPMGQGHRSHWDRSPVPALHKFYDTHILCCVHRSYRSHKTFSHISSHNLAKTTNNTTHYTTMNTMSAA